jgi:hypothetical protein
MSFIAAFPNDFQTQPETRRATIFWPVPMGAVKVSACLRFNVCSLCRDSGVGNGVGWDCKSMRNAAESDAVPCENRL